MAQEEELARLQHRLGQAYFFPFFQPENAKFELDSGLDKFADSLNMKRHAFNLFLRAAKRITLTVLM